MVEVRNNITINGIAATVWDILINFQEYKEWVPYVSGISIHPQDKRILEVSVNAPDMVPLQIKARIKTRVKKKELGLEVTFLNLPVLAKGFVCFRITPQSPGRVRLGICFTISGLFSGFITSEMKDGAKKALADMNLRLSQLAEEKPAD